MELKFDEFGNLVMPPQKPTLDKSGWVRMTRKRWAKIRAHEKEMEQYEEDMIKYMSLPAHNKTKMQVLIEGYEARGKLLRNEGGIVLFDVKSIDTALQKRIEENREYFKRLEELMEERKRKEGVQLTLDGVVRYSQAVRTVPISIIKSFGEKPNVWLEKAWLKSIWYGEPLTSWQAHQIAKRAKEFVGSW